MNDKERIDRLLKIGIRLVGDADNELPVYALRCVLDDAIRTAEAKARAQKPGGG